MVDSVNKTGGASKAIASTYIPGLGQFCDGRNKQGTIYLGSTLALGTYGLASLHRYRNDLFEAEQKAVKDATFDLTKCKELLRTKFNKKWMAVAIIGSLLYIANIIDAARGNKPKEV